MSQDKTTVDEALMRAYQAFLLGHPREALEVVERARNILIEALAQVPGAEAASQ